MKSKLVILLVFVIIGLPVMSQSDTLNRYDSNNKKSGWWIIYLDANLASVKEIGSAIYYRYSYFQDKFDYYSMGPIGTKKNPVIAPVSKKDNLIALDGEYKANFTNGQVRFILVAQKGKLVEYKEFYKNGTVKTRFDYTSSCGETALHYCIYQFKKDGTLISKRTIQVP